MNILITILSLLLLVVLSGLIIYKTGHAPTWEAGIKTLFHWLHEALCKLFDWLQSNDPNARRQDPGLIPSLKQLTILIDKLSGHPYDTPTVTNGWVNDSDIFCVRINTFGLVSRYADLKPSQILEIVCAIVNNFFSEVWGRVPYFYIPYARIDGFMLYIPLSDYGRQALARKIEERQAEAALNQARASATTTPLTEEVQEDEGEAQE